MLFLLVYFKVHNLLAYQILFSFEKSNSLEDIIPIKFLSLFSSSNCAILSHFAAVASQLKETLKSSKTIIPDFIQEFF